MKNRPRTDTERLASRLDAMKPDLRALVETKMTGADAKPLKRALKESKLELKRTPPKNLPSAGKRWTIHAGDLEAVVTKKKLFAKYDFIITDPPYGKTQLGLYEKLGIVSALALKDGGSLLCMTGQNYLPEIMQTLSRFLSYQWTLAYLTPGGQSPQIWPKKVNTFWKPVLWFVKGKYTGDWIGDVVKSAVNDNDKRFHFWGQSVSGMSELLDKFVYPGDRILDPFTGGGSTGIVALEKHCWFEGIELDPVTVKLARKRLRNANP